MTKYEFKSKMYKNKKYFRVTIIECTYIVFIMRINLIFHCVNLFK